jgi:hypothetical protein
VHLHSVRTRFLDHVDVASVEVVSDALSAVADRLEAAGRERRARSRPVHRLWL